MVSNIICVKSCSYDFTLSHNPSVTDHGRMTTDRQTTDENRTINSTVT